ncbi:hypothetical protein VSS37_19035 [Candidatus Thiothrix sp. Deng01]|uniref:Uncharacterized protein n=1 Tax=Candidatus Thiothrix phosphatis TaxID=3112415 RepID=A0ABU6D1Z3_9GAMM|nr:hypothetical protein [Candidatus Thiothrix sp. Deng01]MEB4593083.1 hypothetical protein [Candidatus Thiothrix sp. Deng01]
MRWVKLVVVMAGMMSAASVSAVPQWNGLPGMGGGSYPNPFGFGGSPFPMLNPWGGGMPWAGGGLSPWSYGFSPFSSLSPWSGMPMLGSPWSQMPMQSGMGNPFVFSPPSGMSGAPGQWSVYSYSIPLAPANNPYSGFGMMSFYTLTYPPPDIAGAGMPGAPSTPGPGVYPRRY